VYSHVVLPVAIDAGQTAGCDYERTSASEGGVRERTEFDPPPVAQTHKLHRTLRLADLTIPVDRSPRTDQFGVHTP